MYQPYSAKKRRLLFVGEALTLSHIIRPLYLAQSLDSDRYEILFACDERYRALVEKSGLAWRRLTSLNRRTFERRIATFGLFPLYTFEDLDRYVQDELRLIDDFKPDLVVHDFRHTLATSTALAGVPLISLTDACWGPFSTQTFPLPEMILTRLFGYERMKRNSAPFMSFSIARNFKPYQRLREKYQLSPYETFRDTYTTADHVLYTDIPSIAPTTPLPSNHQYIGPIFWQPDVSLPKWFDDLPRDRPLIYASMGSSGNIRMLEHIVEACTDLPVTVIITTAGRPFHTRLPDNIRVLDFAPALQITQKCAAVICHGGSIVGYQALKYGVPIIGIPSNIAQFFSMEMIAVQNAGILLRESQVNKHSLKKAIRNLLHKQSFKQSAQTLDDEIARYDSQALFRQFIESYPFTKNEGSYR